MPPVPIRLTPSDAKRYAVFRKRMLTEAPWAFAATVEDDLALDLQFLEKALGEKENAILAIEATEPTGSLVASAGIFRMKNQTFSNRAKLWGVYVEPDHRGRGLGRTVTAAAVELAGTWEGIGFIDVGVSSDSPEARKLYESLGFVEWDREPETQHNGGRFDEIHMSLRVERGGA